MSKASEMTPPQQLVFDTKYRRFPNSARYACEYGHFECSIAKLGACHREVVCLIEERRAGVRRKARTLKQRQRLMSELTDKIWYGRHSVQRDAVAAGAIVEAKQAKAWEGALKSAAAIERKYGKENLGPWTDYEWGEMNGKLATLRWLAGEDWETTLDI